jgi:hypothetical protein
MRVSECLEVYFMLAGFVPVDKFVLRPSARSVAAIVWLQYKMTMKHTIAFIIKLFISGFIYSQDTKTIIHYFPDSKQIRETISVLADNPNIKHGKYVLYYYKPPIVDYATYSNSWIQKEGFYNHDIKDSVWKDYKHPKFSDWLEKEEHYKMGKKIGIWLNWVELNVYERYDYDKNKKLIPLILTKSIDYPQKAQENGIGGEVILKVKYNVDYTISSIDCLSNNDSILIRPVIVFAKHKSDLLRKYAINIKDTFMREETIVIDFKMN